ncbi:hypothetical protein [Paracoccus aminophilus]|uniref:Uncharacterized protein n=1 Tax=Paracoccus aminophilus JCM 7686 TaxID=1367847 RepID=S5Y973_PARAH|nr:hypothetical protein [Paracoccus aminophilus]AGT07913.1 hypothetical protein JCM7686_0804 [Paracoccus aminophilus JCM 7686]
MTEQQVGTDLVRAIQSGWPQIVAIVAIIWWASKLDMQVKGAMKRLDRHEERLRGLEAAQHQQAIDAAEIREAMKNIKLTLDRIYSEVSELGRVQHHSERTIPPR